MALKSCFLSFFVLFHFGTSFEDPHVDLPLSLKTCPQFNSKYTEPVDELLGNWHVALLIMDKSEEEFVEKTVCIEGRIMKMNTTSLIQIWNLELPEILRQDKTEVDFPTKIIEPGVWLVQSPLGGHFRGTVIDSDGLSYLVVVYCGWTDNVLSHMFTVALSRSYTVPPNLRLQLLSILVRNGFDPFKNKVLCWSNC